MNGMVWTVVAYFFAENEEELQGVVDEFSSVWKSKVMVFDRREEEVVDFNIPYKMRVPAVGKCEVQ